VLFDLVCVLFGVSQVFERQGIFRRKFTIKEVSGNWPHPCRVAFDAGGNVLVTDYETSCVHICKSDGTLITTFYTNGQYHVRSVCVDNAGRIYVGDNTCVQVFGFML
jgi:hypothetical protein